jgi:hypothetical protein
MGPVRMKGRIRLTIVLCAAAYVGFTAGYGVKHMEASPKREVMAQIDEIAMVLEQMPVRAMR